MATAQSPARDAEPSGELSYDLEQHTVSYEAEHVKVSAWTGSLKGEALPRCSVMATERATAEEMDATVRLVVDAFGQVLAGIEPLIPVFEEAPPPPRRRGR